MKKFYSFFLVAVCLFATSFAYAATRTVYFQKPSQWPDNVSVHIWGNGVGTDWNNDETPALKDSETGLYYYTFEDDRYTGIIFRIKGNDNAQTKDIEIEDNVVYTCMRNQKSNSWKLGYKDSDFSFVYFDDFKSEWGTPNTELQNWEPCVYFFGDISSSDWPGTELVYDETLGYYKGFILKDRTFIFNNGMSNDESEANYKQQTANLTDYELVYPPFDVYAMGKIGLQGAQEATSWNPNNGDFKLSYSGKGVYEINNIQMFEDGKDGETGYSSFRFHTALDSDWNKLGSQYRPTENKILNVGTGTSTTDVTTDGTGDKNWKVVTAYVNNTYYVYDLKLDLLNNKLTIDGTNHTTGVESISVEDSVAPVEYFNLQGVRVENPENGLYIVRQGNKVSKQLIR